jgi:hypothetical protein
LVATLECELIDRRRWRTREQARLEVFWWLEAVDNRARRHSAIGNLSPVAYEATLAHGAQGSRPAAVQGAPVLAGVKATPCGWPAASLDSGGGPARAADGGDGRSEGSISASTRPGRSEG